MSGRLPCLVLILFIAPIASAATRDNDDSCDIAVMPAATLLLPYFEVDLWHSQQGTNTNFSVVNVTNVDQIAHVTIWTDRAYPLFGFDIYLTGYDVQRIDLYDVLVRGVIAPDAGTGTAIATSRRRTPTSDPNPRLDLGACGRLPGVLDQAIVERLYHVILEGTIDGCVIASTDGEHAIGYATIDVVGACGAAGPTDPDYWTKYLRYDNVLTGEYIQDNDAAPLVHIRAVPEGGTAEQRREGGPVYDAGFERTFYARYQPADAPRLDARQPLPSRFAARWLASGTKFRIWRETPTPAVSSCADFARATTLDTADVIAFDENENAAGLEKPVLLPAASSARLDVFPQLPNGAEAGWMYLDLDSGENGRVASQNWVTATLHAGLRNVSIEATALGNGCSAPASPRDPVAPAPDASGSRRFGVASTKNDDSCDIAVMPAATLLLPMFEVDVENPTGVRTLFTVTNVSPRDQIARVTLWTNFGIPVFTFNLALTAYDVQSISVFDALRGVLPAAVCNPVAITEPLLARMRAAFLEGILDGCQNAGEGRPGQPSALARGYVTIDVVSNCSANNPAEAAYWRSDIAFDNVLTGDGIRLDPDARYDFYGWYAGDGSGSPLVHIRAIPEGGTLAERSVHPSRWDAGFPRTFYSRYQSPGLPRLDARQPLPSAFATRWKQGGFEQFATWLEIWREGDGSTECSLEHFAAPTEFVRFDEQENPVGETPYYHCGMFGCFRNDSSRMGRYAIADPGVFPQLTNGATGGWIYLNLDGREAGRRSQSWVVVSMHAPGRAVRFDATPMGNGCSMPFPESEHSGGKLIIGPSPNTPSANPQ